MKCPHCGKEIANSSQFCEYCGQAIKKTTTAKNPWRLIAFLLMAVVAVGVVYVLVHQFGSDTDDLRQDSFYMTGTAAGTPCTIQFDFQTRQGRYTQDLGSGRQTLRDLRLISYADDILVLDAYDTKGRRVSQFSGTLDPQLNFYSGTITNNQGGAINFSVSQEQPTESAAEIVESPATTAAEQPVTETPAPQPEPVEEYVDLGLSSGTLWKTTNEPGMYTFDRALSRFGESLPTKEQCEELIAQCSWRWLGNGYRATGPNGRTVYFPLTGYQDTNGRMYNTDIRGSYWTCTPGPTSGVAWKLYIDNDEVTMYRYHRNIGHAVRLVDYEVACE